MAILSWNNSTFASTHSSEVAMSGAPFLWWEKKLVNEPTPTRPPLNVALICEYIAAQDATEMPGATPTDFARSNAAGLRCMAELPIGAWQRIVSFIRSGSVLERQQLVAELRDEYWPDAIPPDLWVWHRPGSGKPPSDDGPGPSGSIPPGGPTSGSVPRRNGVFRRVLRALADVD